MTRLEIPEAWQSLVSQAWQGPILLIGGPSTGKSTFGRTLYRQLLEKHDKVAYLDADVGQQELGLPATISVALQGDREERNAFPPAGLQQMRFVGSNSPRGHFVPLLLGIHHLYRFALEAGAAAVVVDTSGFIDAERGATILKWAKIDLLRPQAVVAFQQGHELEATLAPLRPLLGSRLHLLPVAPAVRQRPAGERQEHRARGYRAYFQKARRIELSYQRLAVFPRSAFSYGQLSALEDEQGFCLALGILERVDLAKQAIHLYTPWGGEGKPAALRLGQLRLDLDTFQDQPLGFE